MESSFVLKHIWLIVSSVLSNCSESIPTSRTFRILSNSIFWIFNNLDENRMIQCSRFHLNKSCDVFESYLSILITCYIVCYFMSFLSHRIRKFTDNILLTIQIVKFVEVTYFFKCVFAADKQYRESSKCFAIFSSD